VSELRKHVSTCADVGEIIRRRRHGKALTLREVAASSLLTKQAVGAIERAQTDPMLSTLAAIVDALDGKIEISFPEERDG